MNFKLNMSAGELFDLIRPAVLLVAALVSAWVLASARRRGFRMHTAAAWALGTLLFPPIVFPIYLLVRFRRAIKGVNPTVTKKEIPFRFTLPLIYLLVVISLIAWTFYRDKNSVDAHLARASYARVSNDPSRAIQEYRHALTLEENAHTRKLLAIELSAEGSWTEALSEFRLAEKGGEPDESIPFRIAALLEAMNNLGQAKLEYERFLDTRVCTQAYPDNRCQSARAKVAELSLRLR